jgi:CRP/FNR family transcriptional regulator
MSGKAAVNDLELKRLPILAELAENEREAVAEEFEEIALERGARLFGEGDPGGALWFLLEGRVRVLARRHALAAELGAGEALGALSLLGGPRRASVETLSRCRLLRLDRAGLARLAANDPPVAERLLESIAREAAQRADAALAASRASSVDPESCGD